MVLLIVAFLMPTVAGYLLVWARRLADVRARRRASRPSVRPVAVLHADLRRLHDVLERSENAPSSVPAKNQRCIASRAAYVDALTAACRQLQVPLPAGRPVPRSEIYRVEADLRRVGVDVRSGARPVR